MSQQEQIKCKEVKSYWEIRLVPTIYLAGLFFIGILLTATILGTILGSVRIMYLGLIWAIIASFFPVITEVLSMKASPNKACYAQDEILVSYKKNDVKIKFEEIERIYAYSDFKYGLSLYLADGRKISVAPGFGGTFASDFLETFKNWTLTKTGTTPQISEKNSVFHGKYQILNTQNNNRTE